MNADLSRKEFVAIVAALMAIEALAIDIMLPALPDIGAAFQVVDPNDRSLVLTVFLIGFGLPQVVFGPLSDRYGRRQPILIGLGVYIACALASPAIGTSRPCFRFGSLRAWPRRRFVSAFFRRSATVTRAPPCPR